MSIAEIIALLLKILPPLLQGAETVAADLGTSPGDPAVADHIASHLTPGQPNAPSLS